MILPDLFQQYYSLAVNISQLLPQAQKRQYVDFPQLEWHTHTKIKSIKNHSLKMNPEFLAITSICTLWQNIFQKCIFNKENSGSTVGDKEHCKGRFNPKETARIYNATETNHRSQNGVGQSRKAQVPLNWGCDHYRSPYKLRGLRSEVGALGRL